MNTTDDTCKWQDEIALKRFQMISELLDPDLDNSKRIQLRNEIAKQNNLSPRTIYRYEKAYQIAQFYGLKPVARPSTFSSKLPENFGMLLQDAIQLRKEVPTRSVAQIITILELEGKVAPGILKRSTLERHMFRSGFGTQHMKTYCDARQSSSKRFCKPHRMMLIQADIKYGLKLPIGKNGEKVQTYLSSAMDDHSRYLLASEFYDNQEETIVEDTFRKAVLCFGKFDACYFDNGSQYVSRQIKSSLARLGIRINYAPVKSGKSKGKIEKFHQVVDKFLQEIKLKKISSLEELNHLWTIFKEEYYHKKAHDGIREYYESLGVTVPKEGITPEQEFKRDQRALTFIDTNVVAEAFLHHETRLVDKGACISFKGKKYETKASLIGFKVEISYDPAAPEIITVKYPGIEPFTASPVNITSFCDKSTPLPASIQVQEASTSRMLDALEKKHTQVQKKMTDAISFASYRKDGGTNV